MTFSMTDQPPPPGMWCLTPSPPSEPPLLPVKHSTTTPPPGEERGSIRHEIQKPSPSFFDFYHSYLLTTIEMDTPPATPEPPVKDDLALILDLLRLQVGTTLPTVVSILSRIRGCLNFYATMPASSRRVLSSIEAFRGDTEVWKAYKQLVSEDASHFRNSLPLWLTIIDKTLTTLSKPFSAAVNADRNALEARLAVLGTITSCPIVHRMQKIEEVYGLDETTASLTFELATNGFWKGSRGVPVVLAKTVLGDDGAGARFIRVFLGAVEEVGQVFREETIKKVEVDVEVQLRRLREAARTGAIWEQLKGVAIATPLCSHAPEKLFAMANDASSSKSQPLSPVVEKTEPGTTPTDKPHDRRTSRRVSFYGFHPEDAPTDDEAPTSWRCATYQFCTDEKKALPKAAFHRELLDYLCDSNEHFEDRRMKDWLDDKPEEINIGNALDHAFEYLRFLAKHCDDAYNFLLNENLADRAEIKRLRETVSTLEDNLLQSEMERGKMHRVVKGLPPLVTTGITNKPAPPLPPKAETSDFNWDASPGWEPTTREPSRLFGGLGTNRTSLGGHQAPTYTSIEIPKQYRLQLQSNGIESFEGGSDPDTVFTFIKALEFHVETLDRVFVAAQCIEYAISYMRGGVKRWARHWQETTEKRQQSWERFLTAFKARWVPQNAHVHLTSKLENMDLKRNQVDQFNDEFREVLRLLDITDLRTVKASDQYYKLYLNKIRDPSIRQAIQLQSLMAGGLTLDVLMDYTSQLMLVAAASTPQKTTNTQERPPRDKGKRAAGSKSDPITINNVEETKTTKSDQSNRRRTDRGRPRRAFACFACGSAEHGLDECGDKESFYEEVAARKAMVEQSGKE
ncbi:hypothetical protein BJ508DRAFT_304314 [Ascobolus immersus RN42]|uniref:Ty3 transposon capsid-like protein domain-containing protein n=1 Tax=Ascobolus immersus RN42 TaxID=1160509 RepID=A0A3N4ICG3_ASCIM|nr:hypothetical protein BJ508DRAFT_304314 [Ascobolus immersus RN42]